ncbi:MAG: phage tail protein [Pseudomonadota bacterium]
MATLVLSTVGSALGGPVGGAIGALIGQSIDQQILGPGTRGPRLGDLSVQTSSYGTQVPRIYGTMRVAGSVIWSTDLVESTQTAGAKGQPDTTYSYAVSFAVALSSRPAGAIGRIWADGKLLRGEAGDFKVPVTFRFYDGSEDQGIDPLIGSIEGIATTPAYRGLALAVFENLELAEYGNRIPFLTFEVVADALAPGIGSVLGDASGGAISSAEGRTIGGYAAYGKSIAAAVGPLVTMFGVELFDDGETLRGTVGGDAIFIDLDDLGNSADGESAPRITREQLPARALPAALRLGYYDPGRDYQSAEARAAASEERGAEEQRELPAVLAAGEAKALVQQVLARTWAERDRLTLRLPQRMLGLEPGSRIELDLSPRRWTVTQCTVDGLVVVAELRPATGGVPMLAAEAGRVVAPSDVVEGEVSMVLIDASAGFGGMPDQPTVLVAASSATPGWRAKAVEARYGGQRISARTSGRKAVLGSADNVLPAADPAVMDTVNTIDVTLVDAEQWLVSCDDEALAEGANLALVGKELIQFGQADPMGPGSFRLSRLLRGVRGTEAAVNGHVAGEPFVLIEADALKAVTLPPWAEGHDVSVTCGEQSAELTLTSRPKPAAIADPSGGTTADSEAREAIAQVLAALRQQGLIAP